jgi:hypothetical protein
VSLALGDLLRDRRDFDAARRVYETLERNHGPAAELARERLARLPTQPEASSAPATNAVRTPPSVDAVIGFDGTYTGTGQVVGISNPNCRPSLSLTMVVRENKLSLQNATTTVAPDGSFTGYSSIGGSPPISQRLTGKIQNGSVEADTTNPFCRYHISLKKSG